MQSLVNEIKNLGIIPVIKINDASKAIDLANALKKGGLPIAEITFRTDAAQDAIKAIADYDPDFLIGAGTVLTMKQAIMARECGAKFIVTPGFNERIVTFALENGILPIPGCITPTEIEKAMSFGLSVLKFFPAEQSGGIDMLKALSGPYQNIKFIPTGGINYDNLVSYLKTKNVLAVGGSFMAKESDIDNGNFDKIEENTRLAVSTMHGFSILHIGINSENADESHNTASTICNLLGLAYDDRGGAIFAGSLFEVMKKQYLGKNGHIALGCNFPYRAEAMLKKLGVEFNEETRGLSPNGELKVLYFKEDIGGFAFHLLQK